MRLITTSLLSSELSNSMKEIKKCISNLNKVATRLASGEYSDTDTAEFETYLKMLIELNPLAAVGKDPDNIKTQLVGAMQVYDTSKGLLFKTFENFKDEYGLSMLNVRDLMPGGFPIS